MLYKYHQIGQRNVSNISTSSEIEKEGGKEGGGKEEEGGRRESGGGSKSIKSARVLD